VRNTLLVCALFILSFASPNFSQGDKTDKSDDKICHLRGSAADLHVTNVHITAGQKVEDTPAHRYSPGDGCSSKNPKAKPGTGLDGVRPNTVGCKCSKKCVNGQTVEDLSREKDGLYVCRNACHKDRCFCPDPCKS